MAKEICISTTPHETRLAILEDDQLAEIYYERENEYTLAGSIYNGRVTRVLPGMQSAFVDVGLERDAFLYVTDFMELEDPEETDEIEKAAASGGNQPPREVRHGRAPTAMAAAASRSRAGRNRTTDQRQESVCPSDAGASSADRRRRTPLNRRGDTRRIRPVRNLVRLRAAAKPRRNPPSRRQALARTPPAPRRPRRSSRPPGEPE